MELIQIEIIDHRGEAKLLEAPLGMNLSLMEVLKADGYAIQATCGGMALCATCHVQIVEGGDLLVEPKEEELDMLDTLPVLLEGSRLSCQLRIDSNMNGVKLRVFEGD